MMSPTRSRNHSDSMDYDDELAELHDKRERQLKMASSGMDKRFIRDESNEDTEDASEDGEVRHDEQQEIKEQVYHDKLAFLKAQLEELEAGNHVEYNRKLSKIDQAYAERKELNKVWKEYESECIERDCKNETLVIIRDYEEKKVELREGIIAELHDKKKQIEQERYSMELTSDPTDIKPMSTRKLRRRPNEPVPVPEKRRKPPQSQITFLLDEKDMDEDLKAIAKKKVPEGAYGVDKMVSKLRISTNNSSTSSASEQSEQPSESQAPVHMDAKIEDGKLFYEKRWFHRGQPVYVEEKDVQRTSGIISSISPDVVWVRKVNEQTHRIRITISALQSGKMIIKRRA